MEYITAIRKSDNQTLRILIVEISKRWDNFQVIHTETWYIVPVENGVLAMTPSDFEMVYTIQMEAQNESKN